MYPFSYHSSYNIDSLVINSLGNKSDLSVHFLTFVIQIAALIRSSDFRKVN